MNALTVRIDASRFNAMLADFAAIEPGLEFRDIVHGTALRVCAGALRRTNAADPQRIRRDFENREWTTLDGKRYKLSWYLHNDALWHRIEQHRADTLATKLASRGLAKKSWIFFGPELGGIIDAPNFVHSANYKGEVYPEDAAIAEAGFGAGYQLTIFNSSPIVQKAGGARALQGAINGEARYFYVLLEKRAFRTFEGRAARYPGVYVRPSALAA